MVGVPGRSKACHICKQRRIACGLERPQCAQCLKSNRICTGYQRKLKFISSENVDESARTQTRSLSVETENSSSVGKRKPSIKLCLRRKTTKRRNFGTRATDDLLPKDVSPYFAYRQQLLNLFISSHFPSHLINGTPVSEKNWLFLLLEMPTMTRALETSILAVCMSRLGRMKDDQDILNESLRLYTLGLSDLQRALWDAKLMYVEETLAACMALTMYEVLECPGKSGRGYVSHQHGAWRLLQLRGAKAHTSGLGHLIFCAIRTHAIIHSVGYRIPTFLSDQTWLEEPWQCVPKNPLDRILDLLATIPNIYKHAAALANLQCGDLLLSGLEMIDQCWELDAELQRWYKDLETSTPGPLYWPQFSKQESPTDDPELGKLFPVAFHFPSLFTASTIMKYWTAQVMVWSMLTRAYGEVPTVLDQGTISSQPQNGSLDWRAEAICSCGKPTRSVCLKHVDISQLPPLEHRVDWARSAARNLFQFVEYCMQEEMLVVGPQLVAPLVAIVLHRLVKEPGDWSREILWAKSIGEMVDVRGQRVIKYMV